MGVHESSGILSRAAKDLGIQWNSTKMSWRDAMSEAFEQRYIEQLAADLKTAQSAMDQASGFVQQVRRECE